MRLVLGCLAVALAVSFFAAPGFAQGGGCAATCERYSAECQRQLGVTADQCQRAARGIRAYAAECERRERAYANACRTRYNQCLRACGRR
jgi:hypothetical protein